MTTGWQPIETAPKDGTFVLLFSPDAEPRPFIGQWREGDDGFPGDGGAWWPDHEAPFPIDAYPSHWQYLPFIPASTA